MDDEFVPPALFPPMRAKPPFSAIMAGLDRLAPSSYVSSSYSSSTATPSSTAIPESSAATLSTASILDSAASALVSQRAATAIARYLGSVVAADLAWLPSDDLREDCWAAASRCLAARCGRAAIGTLTRHWLLVWPGVEVEVDLVLQEPALVGDALGFKTWGTAYTAAQQLPYFAQSRGLRHLFATPPRILELGAGTGLLGLAAAACYGASVHLTDLPAIVPNLAANVARNASTLQACGAGACTTGVLQWGVGTDEAKGVDLLLVSDPLYDDDHPTLLTAAIDTHLAAGPASRALVTVPQRDTHTRVLVVAFVSAMATHGLQVVDEGTLPSVDADWGGDEDKDDKDRLQFACWWVFGRETEDNN